MDKKPKGGGRNPVSRSSLRKQQSVKATRPLSNSIANRKLAAKRESSSSSVENHSSPDRKVPTNDEAPGSKKSRGHTRDDEDFPELKKDDDGLRMLSKRALGKPVPQKAGRGVPIPVPSEYRDIEMDEGEELIGALDKIIGNYHDATDTLTKSKRCRVQNEKLPLAYLAKRTIGLVLDGKVKDAKIEELEAELAAANARIKLISSRADRRERIDSNSNSGRSIGTQHPAPVITEFFMDEQDPPFDRNTTDSTAPGDANVEFPEGLPYSDTQYGMPSFGYFGSMFRENIELFNENRRLKEVFGTPGGFGDVMDSSDRDTAIEAMDGGQMEEHNYSVVQAPNGDWIGQNTTVEYGTVAQYEDDAERITTLTPTMLSHVENIESYREVIECIDDMDTTGAVNESATDDGGQREQVMFSRNTSPEMEDAAADLEMPPLQVKIDESRQQWPQGGDCVPGANMEASSQYDTGVPKVEWFEMVNIPPPDNGAISVCYGSPH